MIAITAFSVTVYRQRKTLDIRYWLSKILSRVKFRSKASLRERFDINKVSYSKTLISISAENELAYIGYYRVFFLISHAF